METLPRAGIVRIEIRQAGRFFHHISESASIPVEVGRLGCDPVLFGLLFTVTTPAWAYTAASAPFFLAADGIAFFVQPQTFNIVP